VATIMVSASFENWISNFGQTKFVLCMSRELPQWWTNQVLSREECSYY
jgi:hypothetical protein